MNIVFTPYGWEWRIRDGRAVGPVAAAALPDRHGHRLFRRLEVRGDHHVAADRGRPVAALPSRTRPDAARGRRLRGRHLGRLPDPHRSTSRSWAWSRFWTTRVGPIFELYITVELLLSGRLVPLTLMPDWAQQLADFLPFKWTFCFPIEALIGGLTNEQLIGGLGMQVFWIVVGCARVRARCGALRSSATARWAADASSQRHGRSAAAWSAVWIYLRVGALERAAVPRELRRPAVPVRHRAVHRAGRARPGLRPNATSSNGWTQPELLA